MNSKWVKTSMGGSANIKRLCMCMSLYWPFRSSDRNRLIWTHHLWNRTAVMTCREITGVTKQNNTHSRLGIVVKDLWNQKTGQTFGINHEPGEGVWSELAVRKRWWKTIAGACSCARRSSTKKVVNATNPQTWFPPEHSPCEEHPLPNTCWQNRSGETRLRRPDARRRGRWNDKNV